MAQGPKRAGRIAAVAILLIASTLGVLYLRSGGDEGHKKVPRTPNPPVSEAPVAPAEGEPAEPRTRNKPKAKKQSARKKKALAARAKKQRAKQARSERKKARRERARAAAAQRKKAKRERRQLAKVRARARASKGDPFAAAMPAEAPTASAKPQTRGKKSKKERKLNLMLMPETSNELSSYAPDPVIPLLVPPLEQESYPPAPSHAPSRYAPGETAPGELLRDEPLAPSLAKSKN